MAQGSSRKRRASGGSGLNLKMDHAYKRYEKQFRLKPITIDLVNLLDLSLFKNNVSKGCKVKVKSGIKLSQSCLDRIVKEEQDKLRQLRSYRDGVGNGQTVATSGNSSGSSNSGASTIFSAFEVSRRTSQKRKLPLPTREEEAKKSFKMNLERIAQEDAKQAGNGQTVASSGSSNSGASTIFSAFKVSRRTSLKHKLPLQTREEEAKKKFKMNLKKIAQEDAKQAKKPKVKLFVPGHKLVIEDEPRQGGDIFERFQHVMTCTDDVVKYPKFTLEVGIEEYKSEEEITFLAKKIAWWMLKNDEEPAKIGCYHPELHDDDEEDSDDDDVSVDSDDDFSWLDGLSSINGYSPSDPGGVFDDIPLEPYKLEDPDWADEYCGEALLHRGKVRETVNERNIPLDSVKRFSRILEGTPYFSQNFEVTCCICAKTFKDKRAFGAHIRSDRHKNRFRNKSLAMAHYEEKLVTVPPRNDFPAQLADGPSRFQ